jgi:hypothetical protein
LFVPSRAGQEDAPREVLIRMVTYYTDDLTRVPLALLFRLTWKNPLAFVYVAIRRLLKMPFTANIGTARVDSLGELESLCELEWEQIPNEARREMETRVADFARHGLPISFCAKGADIGNKRSYGVTLIDRTGGVYATLTWFQIRVGTLERTGTVAACHSRLTDGRGIHTSAGGESALRHRYLLPPGEVVEILPSDTATSALLVRHQERLTGLGAVVDMSGSMLKAEVLKAHQRIIDRAVEMGQFVPLGPEDVDRLRRIGD